jgi:hypothetical protein
MLKMAPEMRAKRCIKGLNKSVMKVEATLMIMVNDRFRSPRNASNRAQPDKLPAILVASVTGLKSIPCELNPSPSACFCPQSALGRCFMGSAEDRLANLATRNHVVLLPQLRPSPSIVPAKGPCSGGLMAMPARNLSCCLLPAQAAMAA